MSRVELAIGLTGLSGGLESLGTRAALDAIVEAEQHGLNAVWVNEEHLEQHKRSAAASSTLIFLSHLSARTSRLQLGTSVLLASLHHPLRLAEETAALSVLSGERFSLGISVGRSGRYAEAFGIQSEQRYEDAAELLRVLRALWASETVDFETTTYRGSGAVLALLPELPPAIHWGAFSAASVQFAASAGMSLVQHLLQTPESLMAGRSIFRMACADSTDQLTRSPVSRFAYLAETDARAMADVWEAAEALTNQLKEIGIDQRADVTTPESLDPAKFIAETAVVGSPSTIMEKLGMLGEELGTGEFNLNLGWFGHVPPEQVSRSFNLLVRGVLPDTHPWRWKYGMLAR